MSRTRIAGFSLFIALCLPVVTSAATLAELQAQLQSILAQISALTTTAVQGERAERGSCPTLSKNLALGSRGEDVIELQKFLIAQKLLSLDSATGYYGTLTQKAVQDWQAKNNIASSGTAKSTGYGVVGQKTRAAIADCSYLDIPLTILTPIGSGWTSVPVPTSTVQPPQGVTAP